MKQKRRERGEIERLGDVETEKVREERVGKIERLGNVETKAKTTINDVNRSSKQLVAKDAQEGF